MLQAKEGKGRSGSVGSWEEIWKRKRGEQNEDKIFNKSKKLPRSPGEKRLGEEKGDKKARKEVEKEGLAGN